ncbi:MAG: hypothetical protein PHD48_00160 [Alphaproteobacteria bacterium]|nr:hypothetical protein [Alphaproteobacteria bacterium]
MNNPNPWSKFFWNDWENDPALRLCSLAAQGLWMRLLCIAAKSSPTGFVIVAGRPCSSTDIALLTGVAEQEVETLIGELSRNGVFSRDTLGRMYCRRMIRDNKKRNKLRQNGAKGGQASFLNGKGVFAPTEQKAEQATEQATQPQKPESRVHKPERITPEGPPVVLAQSKPKAVVHALASDWSLPEEWKVTSLERNWGSAAIDKQAVKFKQYFGFGKGSDIKRSEKGWRQTWLNWLDRALKIDPDAATFGKADSPAVPTSYPPLPEAVRQKLKGHFAFNESFIQRWLAPCVFDLDAGTIAAPSRFQADYLETHYGSSLRHALGDGLQILVSKKIGVL